MQGQKESSLKSVGYSVWNLVRGAFYSVSGGDYFPRGQQFIQPNSPSTFPLSLVEDVRHTAANTALSKHILAIIFRSLSSKDLQLLVLVSKYWHIMGLDSLFDIVRNNTPHTQSYREHVLEFHLTLGSFPYPIPEAFLRAIAVSSDSPSGLRILALGSLAQTRANDLLALQAFSLSPDFQDTSKAMISLCSKPIVDAKTISDLKKMGAQLGLRLQNRDNDNKGIAQFIGQLASRLDPHYRTAIFPLLIKCSQAENVDWKTNCAALDTIDTLAPYLDQTDIDNHYDEMFRNLKNFSIAFKDFKVNQKAVFDSQRGSIRVIRRLLPHLSDNQRNALVPFLNRALEIKFRKEDSAHHVLSPMQGCDAAEMIGELVPYMTTMQCYNFAKLLLNLLKLKDFKVEDSFSDSIAKLATKLTEKQLEEVVNTFLIWENTSLFHNLFETGEVFRKRENAFKILGKILPCLLAQQIDSVVKRLIDFFNKSIDIRMDGLAGCVEYRERLLRQLITLINKEQFDALFECLMKHINASPKPGKSGDRYRELYKDIQDAISLMFVFIPKLDTLQLDRLCLGLMQHLQAQYAKDQSRLYELLGEIVKRYDSTQFTHLDMVFTTLVGIALDKDNKERRESISKLNILAPFLNAQNSDNLYQDLSSLLMCEKYETKMMAVWVMTQIIPHIRPTQPKRLYDSLVSILKADDCREDIANIVIEVLLSLIDNQFDAVELNDLHILLMVHLKKPAVHTDRLHSAFNLVVKCNLSEADWETLYTVIKSRIEADYSSSPNDQLLGHLPLLIPKFTPEQGNELCKIILEKYIDIRITALFSLALKLTPEMMEGFINSLVGHLNNNETSERQQAILILITKLMPNIPEKNFQALENTLLSILKHKNDDEVDVRKEASRAMGVLCLHLPNNPEVLTRVGTVMSSIDSLLSNSFFAKFKVAMVELESPDKNNSTTLTKGMDNDGEG